MDLGLFLIAALVLFSACTSAKSKTEPAVSFSLPANYVEAEVKNVELDQMQATVFLQKKSSNSTLEFYISRGQGELVLAALHNASLPRPTPHELLFKILKEAGMKLMYVSVDSLEGGMYYASILIETKEGGKIALDARPSDALIIALKYRIPVYVEESLLSAGEMKEEKILKGREV